MCRLTKFDDYLLHSREQIYPFISKEIKFVHTCITNRYDHIKVHIIFFFPFDRKMYHLMNVRNYYSLTNPIKFCISPEQENSCIAHTGKVVCGSVPLFRSNFQKIWNVCRCVTPPGGHSLMEQLLCVIYTVSNVKANFGLNTLKKTTVLRFK